MHAFFYSIYVSYSSRPMTRTLAIEISSGQGKKKNFSKAAFFCRLIYNYYYSVCLRVRGRTRGKRLDEGSEISPSRKATVAAIKPGSKIGIGRRKTALEYRLLGCARSDTAQASAARYATPNPSRDRGKCRKFKDFQRKRKPRRQKERDLEKDT